MQRTFLIARLRTAGGKNLNNAGFPTENQELYVRRQTLKDMIHIISFTDKGERLAEKIAGILEGRAVRCGAEHPLGEWTRDSFSKGNALIYVGAAGIAVRAIAPFVRNKAVDPAVIVVDETGKFAIPILSGHLGGANVLASRIADEIGAEAVITTATDRNNVFSVDDWARAQSMHVENVPLIKKISSCILSGGTIRVESKFSIAGDVPEHVSYVKLPRTGRTTGQAVEKISANCEKNCTGHEKNCTDHEKNCTDHEKISRDREEITPDREEITPDREEIFPDREGITPDRKEITSDCEEISPDRKLISRNCEEIKLAGETLPPNVFISVRTDICSPARTLHLIPRAVYAGIGCRRGTTSEQIANAVYTALGRLDLHPSALAGISTIDIKKDEQGLLEFCREQEIPLMTFPAEELAAVQGDFSSSEFVSEVTGVDCVCERSAVLASGGVLILRKMVRDGVTCALAFREPELSWSRG